jgi:SAM-dependent methyltransferase
MHSARADILASLRRAITSTRNGPVEILIIGGRIRTISDMLEELFGEVEQGRLNASNVRFRILCLDPAAMKQWRLTDLGDHEGFEDRMEDYAGTLSGLIRTLTRYAATSVFQARQLEVEIHRYASYPFIYAFVIGADEIYWGYYTWNDQNEDFDGPVNPCYRLRKSTPEFKDLLRWLRSCAVFLPKACTGVPPPGLSTKRNAIGDMNVSLDSVISVNRAAYDALADDYSITGPERARQMASMLAGFFTRVESGDRPVSALELGPGDGSLSRLLLNRGWEVTAVELSEKMSERVREAAPTAELITDDFLHCRIGDRSFSCIVAVAFIHLFPAHAVPLLLGKIYALLDPGGSAFLSTTIHEVSEEGFLQECFPRAKPMRFRKRFTREELESMLRTAGFSLTDHTQHQDARSGEVVAQLRDPERVVMWVEIAARANLGRLLAASQAPGGPPFMVGSTCTKRRDGSKRCE